MDIIELKNRKIRRFLGFWFFIFQMLLIYRALSTHRSRAIELIFEMQEKKCSEIEIEIEKHRMDEKWDDTRSARNQQLLRDTSTHRLTKSFLSDSFSASFVCVCVSVRVNYIYFRTTIYIKVDTINTKEKKNKTKVRIGIPCEHINCRNKNKCDYLNWIQHESNDNESTKKWPIANSWIIKSLSHRTFSFKNWLYVIEIRMYRCTLYTYIVRLRNDSSSFR